MGSLTYRLLIFNLLLAVFPVGAFLFLGTYERQLLDSQERAMVQQGRILASSLVGKNLTLEAASVFSRLGTRNDARLRVVDKEGRLLADSATPEPKDIVGVATLDEANIPDQGQEKNSELQVPDEATEEEPSPQHSVIYWLGATPARIVRRLGSYLQPPDAPRPESEYYSGKNVLDGPEVLAALNGRYGATTRISQGQISVTLYSAIPIIWEENVTGAVLVSKSTASILSDLYQLRLDIMIIFLIGVGAAIVLSVLVSRTVTVPVGRLRDQAESLLDERGKLQDKFKPLSGKDEVADLSRALYTLSSRLQERTDKLEDFIADLVHEIKNPVASIISSAEIASEAENQESGRFLSIISKEARRIEHLSNDLRELINIDMNLDKDQLEPVDLDALLSALVESYPHHHLGRKTLEYCGNVKPPPYVQVNPDRIAQAVINLLDNAISFSPEGGVVNLDLTTDEKMVRITVGDSGPGIPPDMQEKIFNRWYTDRPLETDENHTGLGLAIVKGLANGYGGRVYVRSGKQDNPGAHFTMELPLV